MYSQGAVREMTTKKFLLSGMIGMILFSSRFIYKFHPSPSPAALENGSLLLPPRTAQEEAAAAETATARRRRRSNTDVYYDKDGGKNEIGIVSSKDPSFFRAHQEEIDDGVYNDRARCRRYGFGYNDTRRRRRRRIFFGALVASEPWELFEIVAAEARGLYDGIVLVESNRTQNFTPRNLTKAAVVVTNNGTTTVATATGGGDASNNDGGGGNSTDVERTIARLFGIDNNDNTGRRPPVRVRFWADENSQLRLLQREKEQRNDILKGWKELGMGPNDVAILSDIDETFTRDFLVALRTCDTIPELDYDKHKCHPSKMGLRGAAQIYESSPECAWPVSQRRSFQPSIFSGHCIEGIGGDGGGSKHKPAPRDPNRGFDDRLPGWGYLDWNESNPYTPLVNGGDFRSPGAKNTLGEELSFGTLVRHAFWDDPPITAYHFHNFFVNANSLRFKYGTYGHPLRGNKARDGELKNLHGDLKMMVRCVVSKNDGMKNDDDNGHHHPLPAPKHVLGGFDRLDPFFTPIYFRDESYRKTRHERVRAMVLRDEISRHNNNRNNKSSSVSRRRD